MTRTLKRLFHPILFALLVIAIAGTWYSFGVMRALADTPASSAGKPAITDATQLVNPVTSPLDAVDQLGQLERLGWPLLVLAALIMLMDGVGAIAARYPTSKVAAWLGRGRRPMIVAGAGTCAAAAFHSLALGGNWYAMVVAVTGAALALRSPHPSPTLQLASKRGALTTVLVFGLVFAGCGSAQDKAIKQAEIACVKQTAAAALAKLAAAQAAGTSKTAVAVELTAEELTCALQALLATTPAESSPAPAGPATGSGSGSAK